MVEQSGKRISITYTGLRPGEKLHEELFNPYERPQPTPAERILRAEREPRPPQVVDEMFDQIGLLVLEGDAAGLGRARPHGGGGREARLRRPGRLVRRPGVMASDA